MRLALDTGQKSPIRTTRRSMSRVFEHPPGFGSASQRPVLHGIQARCACGGMCPRCQVKPHLSVGAPDDQYEKEAEAAAARVMKMTGIEASTLQHACAVQRKGAACSEESRLDPVSPSRSLAPSPSGSASAPANVGSVLRSSGQALAPESRTFFESRLGFDFSGVRVHTNVAAQQSALEMGALAYTLGHDIVFGAGQFAPWTDRGRRLLAHELTHVIQQQGVPLENRTRNKQINPSVTRIDRRRIQKQDDKSATAPSIDWSQREMGNASSSQPLSAVRERALVALRATEAALRAAIESRDKGSGVPQAISDALSAAFPNESDAFLDLLLRRVELVQRIVPDVRIYHARQLSATVDLDKKTGSTLHNYVLANFPDCPAAAIPKDKYIVTFPAWDRSEKYQPTILIHECFHYYFAEMIGHSTEEPSINPAAYHSFIARIAGLDSGGSGLSCDINIDPTPIIRQDPSILDMVPREILGLPDTAQPSDTGDQGGGVEAL